MPKETKPTWDPPTTGPFEYPPLSPAPDPPKPLKK